MSQEVIRGISSAVVCSAIHFCQIDAPKIVCGTLAVDSTSKKKRKLTPAEVMVDRISSVLYEKCRQKTYELSGFPDFAPLLSELSAIGSESRAGALDGYKVTSLHPSGNLIIQEQFFQQFQTDEFQDVGEFDQLVEEHNSKYNADNLRMVERGATAPAPTIDMKLELVSPETGAPTAETIAGLPNAFGT